MTQNNWKGKKDREMSKAKQTVQKMFPLVFPTSYFPLNFEI